MDFSLDSESLNYPCCILYSPLLPHCCKMYEKCYDTSCFLVQYIRAVASDADNNCTFVFSLRYRPQAPDLHRTKNDDPGG